MRKTAIVLMCVGFVFIYFTVPVAGVDLLIDAVGYLLIFNGAWAFRLTNISFKIGALTALGLVPVAALQLFISGNAGSILELVRNILTFALLGFLMHAFAYELSQEGSSAAAIMCRGIFGLNMIAVTFFSFLLAPASPAAASWCIIVCRIILLAFLLWTAFRKTAEKPES